MAMAKTILKNLAYVVLLQVLVIALFNIFSLDGFGTKIVNKYYPNNTIVNR